MPDGKMLFVSMGDRKLMCKKDSHNGALAEDSADLTKHCNEGKGALNDMSESRGTGMRLRGLIPDGVRLWRPSSPRQGGACSEGWVGKSSLQAPDDMLFGGTLLNVKPFWNESRPKLDRCCRPSSRTVWMVAGLECPLNGIGIVLKHRVTLYSKTLVTTIGVARRKPTPMVAWGETMFVVLDGKHYD